VRPRPGQLERTLSDITLGVERVRRRSHQQAKDSGGNEAQQQIRIPISGTVASGWGFVVTQVGFLYPFLWLPVQRQAPFETPHFSYGFDFEGYGGLIGHAGIKKWNIDDSMNVLGATVEIGVTSPNTTKTEEPFRATVHLTFQGYAADYEEGAVG
jgi:hypothetical protein